jgi:fumarate hydratase, class II
MSDYRIETDSLGEVRVPVEAYYGAQTQRAVENFPISRLRFSRELIRALGLVKRAAAEANMALGLLDPRLGEAIVQAADEVVAGELDAHFVVDVFQTGSGTSTNMNANEVIANRAIERLGGERGSKTPVHPNDHVNLGQSSNDVIPTALHVAARLMLGERLLPALRGLQAAFDAKARELDDVIKIGRTHLQDAVPIRLGQEFSAYASQLEHGIERLERVLPSLSELALGGTAVGTGLARHPDFAVEAIARLDEATGLSFTPARNYFEALSARDAAVEASGALKTVAVSLTKIANDLRWLSSGPRCGIGEINLPSQQPGSSIMPGKVNPVLPEAMAMVCAQVIGNDLTITLGGQSGNFELNVMKPVIAHNLLESIELLANGCEALRRFCVEGITANRERAASFVEMSLAMATALAPHIGYDAASRIAKESWTTGRSVRELAREQGVLPEDALERVLDARAMTEPGFPGK